MNIEGEEGIFTKQVYKVSTNSYGIVIPAKLVKKYDIKPGDVVVGKFVFINKQRPKC